jgi:hypothetical protein
MKAQFKNAYRQIRSGKSIEDFWGEQFPYSVLRAASEAARAASTAKLDTRLANFKTGKIFFVA